jgi:hypothetical protein
LVLVKGSALGTVTGVATEVGWARATDRLTDLRWGEGLGQARERATEQGKVKQKERKKGELLAQEQELR